MYYNESVIKSAISVLEKCFDKKINLEKFVELASSGNILVRIYENKTSVIKNLSGINDSYGYYEIQNIISSLLSVESNKYYNNVVDILFESLTLKSKGNIYYNAMDVDTIYVYVEDTSSYINEIFLDKICTNRYTFICDNSLKILKDLEDEQLSYDDFKAKWATVNDIMIFNDCPTDSNKDWKNCIRNSIILTKLNMSNRQMAIKSGLSQPTIKRVVEGSILVSNESVQKLSNKLGVKLYVKCRKDRTN